MELAGHVALLGEERNSGKVLVRTSEGKKPKGRITRS
jgi:hypothetical protein